MLAELLEQDHRQQTCPSPASGDHMERGRCLADFLTVLAGELLPYVSITFHWRGIDSRVRVTSSPSLRSRLPPQQSHAVGRPITTRSRGRCSGKVFRSGRLRVNPATVVVLATALSAASSSSVALASSSSNCSVS